MVRAFHNRNDTQDDANNPNTLLLYPDACMNFSPASGWPVELDYVYSQFADLGLVISPAMMSTIPAYAGGQGYSTRIPISWVFQDGVWKDISDPRYFSSSYLERSDWIYQYIGRFGDSNVPPCELNIVKKMMLQEKDSYYILKHGTNRIEMQPKSMLRYGSKWKRPMPGGWPRFIREK